MMSFEVEIVMNRMNNLLNAKYEKDPDFSKQRKNWAFFVSIPLFIELKCRASEYKGVCCSIVLMREVELEVLGCNVFASDGLAENDLYFAEKLNIKEN